MEEQRYSVTRTNKGEDKRVGSAVLTLLTMLTAGGATAVMFFTWMCRKNDFYAFTEWVITVMEVQPYIQQLVWGSFAVSVSLFGSSLMTGTFALFGNQRMAKFGLVLMFLSAGMMTVGGILSIGYVGDLDANVQEEGAGDPANEKAFKELQDFSMAMYSTCCLADEGLSQYVDPVEAAAAWGSFVKVEDVEAYTSDFLRCETLRKQYEQGDIDLTSYALASCYNNNNNLQWFERVTKAGDIGGTNGKMCTVFGDTLIDITSATLIDIEVAALTNGVTDIVIRGRAKAGILGCGGGKLKAFQFIIYLWFQSVCKPIALSLIIVGIASVLITIFGATTTCLGNSSEVDVDMSTVRDYMQRSSVRAAALREYNSAAPLESVQVAQPVQIDDKI